MYGAETWTFRKVDQKYLESFEMLSWKRMETIWTDRVEYEDVLHRVKEGRNIQFTIKRRRLTEFVADLIGTAFYTRY